MNYQRRRRLYSQNFFRNPELVNKLIRNSSIDKKDLVIEIGPGTGSITRELVRAAGKVIAVEIDEKLTLFLKNKLSYEFNLEIINLNFLNYNLPDYPFKVFANIPFNISADILRKLTEDQNFSEGYLVVQKEFAKKVVGRPYDEKNSMLSALLKPWFDISVYHKFSRQDFVPFPHVDSEMIHIKRLNIPLVPYFQKDFYTDYVTYIYNRERSVNKNFDNVLEKFNVFIANSDNQKIDFVHKDALKIVKAQKNIQKINRTRNDLNWRKF